MEDHPFAKEVNLPVSSPVDSAKLLYVDDEPMNLSLFRSTFGDEFQILLAISGEVALHRMELEPDIACIITDQRMPGISGTELLAIVRETYPQTIRMIISAWSGSEILMEAVNQGNIYRYITKPWCAEEVRQCLHNAVEKYFLQQEREQLLNRLKKSNEQLRQHAEELKKANSALKAMLGQGTVLREEMEENVFANVNQSLLPLLQNLRNTPLDDRQSRYINLLEKSLAELTSPFSRNLSSPKHHLTSIEKKIADMVCAGSTSKEISFLLGLSPRTIETHRYRIRNKLGVKDRRTSLQELLSSFFS